MTRVDELLGAMTLEEKLAQLGSVWVEVDPATGQMAAHRGGLNVAGGDDRPVAARLEHGIGQLTRPFGSRPVEPAVGARAVADAQRHLTENTRLGVPAIVHEECLTGFMAHRATTFPAPLSYGATWDTDLIRQVGAEIRRQMRAVGVHQGLAPVLDVVRDARWGRVEECIGEDPYLVGVIGSAYVKGLEGDDPATGIVATVKHFAGHSGSEGGRNLAPAHIGRRELEDVFLVPFEMAIRLGGARAVMNAYQDNDGEPVVASSFLLTGVLRDRWGFEGIVVSDYFSIAFLLSLHQVLDDPAAAAARALGAGLDVELPGTNMYGGPLRDALARGLVDEASVDRAVRRVLHVKEGLGLLDGPGSADPSTDDEMIELDTPEARALARRVADASIVLLKNEGDLLPLTDVMSVAVIGPLARLPHALLGNYSFTNHVAYNHPDLEGGIALTSVADALAGALGPTVALEVVDGCDVLDPSTAGFADAVAAAERADAVVIVLGDRAGHFGAGTVGEGTDSDDLRLPGAQQDLLETVVAAGRPTIAVLNLGRPYDLSWAAAHVPAMVAAFLPGEEGAAAIAGVLTGAVNPSGKTTVTFGRGAGQQPFTYLHKPLARRGYRASSTRPIFPFGHGLSYTTFEYTDLEVTDDVPVDGDLVIGFTVRNTGDRDGDEVAQVYTRDPVASVTRPVQELKAFGRVHLAAGAAARVSVTIPTDVLSFTGLDYRRVVEPGAIEVMVGSSCADIRLRRTTALVGATRVIGEGRRLLSSVESHPA